MLGDTQTSADTGADDPSIDAADTDSVIDSDTIPGDTVSDVMDGDSIDSFVIDSPLFELPDLAEWDPEDDHMGEPGWQDSTEPWCTEPGADWEFIERRGFDVWSDERGVFVYLNLQYTATEITQQYRLDLNDGTGWSVFQEFDADSMGWGDAEIFGIPNGPLMLLQVGENTTLIDDGAWTRMDTLFRHVFIVDETLGYATLPGAPRLARWDGSLWSPFPGEPVPYEVGLVWANRESVYCSGSSGTMLSLEGGEWIVHDTRTMEEFSAMWGFGHDDVWASTFWGSLIHFDGASWEATEWPDLRDISEPCGDHVQAIRGMWGEDGILYLHTEYMFFVWDGASFTVLGYWPGVWDGSECIGRIFIQSIWGNSPLEVFLAVYDPDNASRACGREEYLLRWDGAEFHWF